MPDTVSEVKKERRRYPRIEARCPVNYFTRVSGSWNQARLQDYSAGGVCFVCNETLQEDTKITVHITRSAHKEVPVMAASAVVVRCEQGDDRKFKVACRFTYTMQDKPERNRFTEKFR